jgi:hypothetical protein
VAEKYSIQRVPSNVTSSQGDADEKDLPGCGGESHRDDCSGLCPTNANREADPLAHFTASHYLQRRLHRLPGQDVTASGRAAHHQQNELVKE